MLILASCLHLSISLSYSGFTAIVEPLLRIRVEAWVA